MNWFDLTNNYVLKNTEYIERMVGVSSDEALVWHYIRHPKPWKLKRAIKNKLKGMPISPYWSEWHKTYRLVLEESNEKCFKVRNLIKCWVSKNLVS